MEERRRIRGTLLVQSHGRNLTRMNPPLDDGDLTLDRDAASSMVDPAPGQSFPRDAGPLGPPDETTAGGPPRRRRWSPLRRAVSTLVVVLVLTLIASGFVRVDYYRLAPGSLYHTEQLITVEGEEWFPADTGQIDFTTVSSKKASVLEYYLAQFDEAVELRDAKEFERGRTPEENRQENLEMMASAKEMAEIAALRKLGYPIEINGTGALVKEVRDGLPAASVLERNDTIVEADGVPIELGEDLVRVLSARRPGDTVSLRVESAPEDPGRTVTVALVSQCEGKAPGESCSAEEAAKPLLGVMLSNRDTSFVTPVDLRIETKDVGGPSAGLALGLGVIDVLTPGNLTGGRRVAATGTLDYHGTVGPVGGIKQKTHLVMRENIELFLVPAGEEYEEASRYAAGSATKVVPVQTLDDALNALRDHGGSTKVVEEVAAARSTTTPPAN
jgi:Lon-like protease